MLYLITAVHWRIYGPCVLSHLPCITRLTQIRWCRRTAAYVGEPATRSHGARIRFWLGATLRGDETE
jgi:hypothetical protein